MLRAANQPGDALDVLIAELRSQLKAGTIEANLLRTAVETAGHANRVTDTVPLPCGLREPAT